MSKLLHAGIKLVAKWRRAAKAGLWVRSWTRVGALFLSLFIVGVGVGLVGLVSPYKSAVPGATVSVWHCAAFSPTNHQRQVPSYSLAAHPACGKVKQNTQCCIRPFRMTRFYVTRRIAVSLRTRVIVCA